MVGLREWVQHKKHVAGRILFPRPAATQVLQKEACHMDLVAAGVCQCFVLCFHELERGGFHGGGFFYLVFTLATFALMKQCGREFYLLFLLFFLLMSGKGRRGQRSKIRTDSY